MTKLLPLLALFAVAPAFASEPAAPPIQAETRESAQKKQEALADEADKQAKTPEFEKVSKLLAAAKPERCGLCAVRADSGGIYCRVPLRLEDNCRDNCGEDVLLVSAKTLKKNGFTSEGEGKAAADAGYVASGDVKLNKTALLWAVEKAQRLKGVNRRKFKASPVVTCR